MRWFSAVAVLRRYAYVTTFTSVIQRRFAIRIVSVPSWKLGPRVRVQELSVRRPSVRPSVCTVEISWSYSLEFLKITTHGWLANIFTFCIPQHDGSTPKDLPPNFSWNRKNCQFSTFKPHLHTYLVTYFHSWLRPYKTSNISETVKRLKIE